MKSLKLINKLNAVVTIPVIVTDKGLQHLEELHRRGLYGLTVEDVAGRLIDRALIELFEKESAP